MSFYNEIFIEKENKLIHIASCTGSDTPCYFEEIKNLNDWNTTLEELKKEGEFWLNTGSKHPFPWSSYKTSDHLIVLREAKKKWFEFWKPSHEVWISVEKGEIKDQHKSYFIRVDKWGGDCEYNKKDFIVLEFPPIK